MQVNKKWKLRSTTKHYKHKALQVHRNENWEALQSTTNTKHYKYDVMNEG